MVTAEHGHDSESHAEKSLTAGSQFILWVSPTATYDEIQHCCKGELRGLQVPAHAVRPEFGFGVQLCMENNKVMLIKDTTANGNQAG